MEWIGKKKSLVLLLAVTTLSSCQAMGSVERKDKKNHPDYVMVRTVKGEDYKSIKLIETGKIDSSLPGVWQYGLLATVTYEEEIAPDGQLTQQCKHATRYSDRWRRLADFSENEFEFDEPSGQVVVPGFSYSVWRDNSAEQRNRVAIVFRGTDEWSDWYSNARWITRFNPATADQYQLTRKLVGQLVPELQKKFGSDVEIVAVGHSLGGGLAQHAGYSSPHISSVYAFASSPVTGHISVHPSINRENRQGLEIFRINESGEILAAGRWFHRRLIKLSEANPRVVELLFSFRQGQFQRQSTGADTISQHSIRTLSCDMICHIEHGNHNAKCLSDAD